MLLSSTSASATISWLESSFKSAAARFVVPTPAIRSRSFGDFDCCAAAGFTYAPRARVLAAAVDVERNLRREKRGIWKLQAAWNRSRREGRQVGRLAQHNGRRS